MKTLWQDVRYAARALWQRPGFALVAIVTLALGIGANTAIFSVVNAVILQPLAFADPEQLVAVKSVNPRGKNNEFGGAAPADLFDWSDRQQSFASIAGGTGGGLTLTAGDRPELLSGARVSEQFFDVYGVQPALGRTFGPDDKAAPGKTAVISYDMWRTQFNSDPAVVGRSLATKEGNITIIGVMPPGFKEPFEVKVWTLADRASGEMRLRNARYVPVTARLRAGVSLERAQAEMSALAKQLEEQYPASNKDWGVELVPLQDKVVGPVRPALLILLGAVGLVLLIACANVANLLLARGAERQREMAIRAALGASRGRVLRQMLIESLTLAVVAGFVGVLLALWGVEALVALVPESMQLPRLDEVRVDPTVLGFALLVSVLTGLFFGLAPGLQASRTDLQESLKDGSRGATAGPQARRTRSLLIVAEIALTFVLLVGAGLLIKSLVLLLRTDPGIKTENLLVLNVGAPMPQFVDDRKRAAFFQQIVDGVAAVPGVTGVAANQSTPVSMPYFFAIAVEGKPAGEGEIPQANYSAVSPNYFRTMSVPLLAGREFSARDTADSPRVAVINDTMRRRLFADEDPLGKRVTVDYLNRKIPFEIVGVVGDVKQGSLAEETGVEIYTSNQQMPWFGTALFVRTGADPNSFLEPIKRAIWAVDPNQTLAGTKQMKELLGASTAQPRFYAGLLAGFAALALLLASIGLYGVMSYQVARRTHEIGVRMALGARGGDVLRLVIGQGMTLVLVGLAAGVVASLALTRVMRGLLYGVGANDPWTMFAVAGVLTLVTLVACYLPARRATRVDPLVALRYE